MAISFRCDHCGKLLNTSDDKAGRQARCPGCGQAVTVPEPLATEHLGDVDEDDDDDADLPAEDAPPEESLPDPRATQTCPMCGASNPIKARTCQSCGEAFGKEGYIARRGHKPLEVGATLSTAWDIFKDNLLIAVVAALIYLVLWVVWIYATMISGFTAVAILDPQEDIPLAVPLIAGGISALSFFALGFFGPGYARVMLGLARGDDVNLTELFSGGHYFIRGLFASLVYYACVSLGLAACIAPGVLVILVWWAFLLVLVDEDAPGFSCLTRARELMQNHWMEVFLIGLVGYIIHMFASQTCCIVALFSQAYLSLLMAVVYVRISGQLTAEERTFDDEDDEETDEDEEDE